MKTLKHIQKVTVKYVAVEDRLRLSAELTDSFRLNLWLTQRLSIALIRNLVKGLERAHIPTDYKRNSAGATPKSAVIDLTRQQAAAAMSLPKTEGVRVLSVDPQWLIRSVDIVRKRGRVQLTFRWTEETGACIVFTQIELQQWLFIVYKQFQYAHWPLTAWPTWFSSSLAGDSGTVSGLLH